MGTVTSISKNSKDKITDVNIMLKCGKQCAIPKLEFRFVIMDKMCITRKHYGITIHKSQGLSLENAVIEAGNNIFSNGQTYVALSRVTKLEGNVKI